MEENNQKGRKANIQDILINYLKVNGYDGLYNLDGECACKTDGLIPCDGNFAECLPGYEEKCNGENCSLSESHHFHICKEKPAPNNI